MNYRHAFHAGNQGDCLKHALLVWLLHALRRKQAPFAVLDTHAGIGTYALADGEAERTGEWRDGIARLLHDPPAPLADYVALVAQAPGYPGSPAIARALLRESDHLTCCELQPADAIALRRHFRGDDRVAVHARDGYAAIRALLPPAQRRGLVLIDPPFEATGEFDRVTGALLDGQARFGHGIYAAWYPIKHRSPVTAFHERLRHAGLRDLVAAELWLREPSDPARLAGSGLVVRNPPFGFEDAAHAILDALLARLPAGPGAGCSVLRLTDE